MFNKYFLIEVRHYQLLKKTWYNYLHCTDEDTETEVTQSNKG